DLALVFCQGQRRLLELNVSKKLLDVHGVEPSCLCCRFYGSIGAKPCQALFALGGMLACAGHIIGRDSLRPPCVRVRVCVCACGRAHVCECVRVCVRVGGAGASMERCVARTRSRLTPYAHTTHSSSPPTLHNYT